MEKILQNLLDFLDTQRQHMSSFFGLITLLLLFAYNPLNMSVQNISMSSNLSVFADQVEQLEELAAIEEVEQVEFVEEIATISHIVTKGDSLWRIAEMHLGDGNRWNELIENNTHISNPSSIEVGMEITIPGSSQQTIAQASPTTESEEFVSYTVQQGDSLWSLSSDHLGDAHSWQQLLEINQVDPYNLEVGQQILIPQPKPENLISYVSQ